MAAEARKDSLVWERETARQRERERESERDTEAGKDFLVSERERAP